MDPAHHPDIESWSRQYGGDLDYLDFASTRLSLADWASIARVFCPKFVEVSECVIWARAYDPDNFREWKAALDEDPSAIEWELNQLRLWQFIDTEHTSQVDEDTLTAIAECISLSWQASLKNEFPDKEFKVLVNATDDGPQVGFFTRRR